MALRQTNHVRDQPIGKQIRRTIGHWLWFCEPGGSWEDSAPSPDAATGKPDGWHDDLPYQYYSRKGPLQTAIGIDGAGRPHATMRRADNRKAWLEIAWVGGSPATVSKQGRRIIFDGFAPQSRLAYIVGRHRLDKVWRLNGPGHPASFDFVARTGPGYSITLVDQSLIVRDPQGIEVLRTHAPRGWDTSTVAPTVSGAQPTRVHLTELSPPPQWDFRGRLTPHPDDLATAVYPVFVDPTTIISGTAAIEDAFLQSNSLGNNFGGSALAAIGMTSNGVAFFRQMYRVLETEFPAGTINALRMKLYRISNASSTIPGTLDFYRVKAANPWGEGEGDNTATAPDECSFISSADPTPWAGSLGCGTSGTDYDADATPPGQAYSAYVSGPDVLVSIDLTAAWATSWRDATHANEGMVLRSRVENNGSFFLWNSTEAGSNNPTFEVDVTPAVTPSQKFSGASPLALSFAGASAVDASFAGASPIATTFDANSFIYLE